MRTRNPLPWAALALLLTGASRAATPAADPCLKADEMTDGERILSTVPENDETWQIARSRRGIFKQDGAWALSIHGGTVSPPPSGRVVDAFRDYCEMKAGAAASAARAKAAAGRAAAAPPPPAEPPPSVQARTEEVRAKNKSLFQKAMAFVGRGDDAPAVEEPKAQGPACRKDLCGMADSCRAAGMDLSELRSRTGGLLVTERRCLGALSETPAGCCP